MTGAKTLEGTSTKLLKVAERAKRDPEGKFYSLAYLIDEETLKRAYHRIRKDAAVGVDGVTHEEYGQNLEANIRGLHERMKAMKYRHQPIRRVHIPKEKGKTRPIGVSSIEDKIVQGAITEVLQAVYEQDFLECSYGFRPGRRAHDAIRTLTQAAQAGEVNWLLEADFQSYFDSINRKLLIGMLQARVPDGSMLRLIGKCLHVGVLDGEEFTRPEDGTVQGSILSPLLGNIYLHTVLDVWFEKEIRPTLAGKATLVRYADDLVLGFERQDDAQRVQAAFRKRMEEYGLTLHPEKTRLIPFGRPLKGADAQKGSTNFDFLGFTFFWRRTRGGGWAVGCKTRRARLARAVKSVGEWCRRHRHLPIKEQHKALCRRIQGHFNYFGVNGNTPQLAGLVYWTVRAWYKWLRRRSQRTRLNWERYRDLLRDFPLPVPRVMVEIWGK